MHSSGITYEQHKFKRERKPSVFRRIELPEHITKELEVDADGKVTVTRRGLAHLCGVDARAIRHLLKTLSEGGELELPRTLVPFAGQSFEGGDLSDVFATAVRVNVLERCAVALRHESDAI